jgi:hypothetical protein
MFTINARATSELAATPVSPKKRGEVSVRRSSTKACFTTGTDFEVCLVLAAMFLDILSD